MTENAWILAPKFIKHEDQPLYYSTGGLQFPLRGIFKLFRTQTTTLFLGFCVCGLCVCMRSVCCAGCGQCACSALKSAYNKSLLLPL
jgi:hypothetical protein